MPAHRSEDLRRWFLQNEVELFKWRFVNNPPDNMNEWLKGHSMNYAAVRDTSPPLSPQAQSPPHVRIFFYLCRD